MFGSQVFLCDKANYAYTVDEWGVALLLWDIKGYIDEEKLDQILEQLSTILLLAAPLSSGS